MRRRTPSSADLCNHSRAENALLPLPLLEARGFGDTLSPVTFSAQILLTSELLRTL